MRNEARRLIRDHISLQPFLFAQCAECRVWFVTDPPVPERLGSYYENDAGAAMHNKPGRVFATLRRISIDRDLRSLLARLPPGSAVVDFGTGDGSVARRLDARGYRVGAVDLYDPSEWHDDRIGYQQYAMTADPLDSSLFAVDGQPAAAVILRHVLEHMIEPRDVLDLATRAGVGFVSAVVPNADSRMARRFGDSWYYWDPPRHLTAFSPRSLRRLGDRAGFDVAELTTSGVDEIVTSGHRALLLTRAPSNAWWHEKAIRLTRPTGLVAGLSSASAAFFAASVCRVLYESRVRRAQEGVGTPASAYTRR